MKRFYQDDRKNKAAYILNAMSPDMVRDIIHLATSEGYSVIDHFNDPDSPPKPFALFSRAYVPDADFPSVFVGASTVMLSEFRTLNFDGEFYKKVLVQAFSIPDDMATNMSNAIETRDIIGGSKDKAKSIGWFERFTLRAAEDIRRIANSAANFLGLPWYNDQDQQFDVDCLYELKKLGEAVVELQSRARLAEGQSNLAISLGLFKGYKGVGLYQLGSGDVANFDPDTAAEIHLLKHAQPLMGDVLPPETFGGLGKFVQKARAFAAQNLKSLVDSDDENSDIKRAHRNITQGIEGPSKAAELVRAGIPVNDLVAFLQQYMVAPPATGDVADHVYARVLADYGPDIAQKFASGDLPGAFSRAIEISAGELPSTGDPSLDEELVGDVMAEEDSIDTDPEIGGLFKRLKAKIKLAKARKALRKKRNFRSRQNRKDRRQQSLDDADQQLAAARNWGADSHADAMESEDNYNRRFQENYNYGQQPSFDGYGPQGPDDGQVDTVPVNDRVDYFNNMPDVNAGYSPGGPVESNNM